MVRTILVAAVFAIIAGAIGFFCGEWYDESKPFVLILPNGESGDSYRDKSSCEATIATKFPNDPRAFCWPAGKPL